METTNRAGHQQPETNHKFKATRVFKKELKSFKDRGIEAHSWVLINEKDGTRAHFNTYDNQPQGRVSAFMHDLSPKLIRRFEKEYDEVTIDDCTLAEQA